MALRGVQEVPQPELQPLSMEAKTATAVLKYLQLQAPLLPPVTGMLQEAAQVDLWATRGAALAYTQVWAMSSAASCGYKMSYTSVLLPFQWYCADKPQDGQP